MSELCVYVCKVVFALSNTLPAFCIKMIVSLIFAHGAVAGGLAPNRRLKVKHFHICYTNMIYLYNYQITTWVTNQSQIIQVICDQFYFGFSSGTSKFSTKDSIEWLLDWFLGIINQPFLCRGFIKWNASVLNTSIVEYWVTFQVIRTYGVHDLLVIIGTYTLIAGTLRITNPIHLDCSTS